MHFPFTHAPASHCPHVPPHPSEPHSLSAQLGVQQIPALHFCPALQPQSAGQVSQFSPWSAWQTASPQKKELPHPPHWFSHSPTQMESHCDWQQYGSIAQTHASHLHPPHPGEPDVLHPSPPPPPPTHVPAWHSFPAGQAQSSGQVPQFSPRFASQAQFPQLPPPPQPPHGFSHSSTHSSSHCTWQQKESMLHTQLSHAHPPQPGLGCGVHPPPPPPPEHFPAWQVCPAGQPQSAQVEQFSPWPASQIPFPQALPPPHPPHWFLHSSTQMESHWTWQQ